MTKATMTIYRIGDHPALALAAKELDRCLRKMAPVRVTVRGAPAYNPQEPGIYLCVGDDLRSAIGPHLCRPSRFDDEILLRSLAQSLLLSGSNPRSVFFAAYRLLQEVGARWPFPGKKGEYLPRLDRLIGFDVHEKAAYRHRAVICEGAVSLEHVLDYVAWMPKAAYNALYLELHNFEASWRAWYERPYNPDFPLRRLTIKPCAQMCHRVIAALKERHPLLHRVGHGWTAETIGARAIGWAKARKPVPPDKKAPVARVNGKRDWWMGIPLNTELCYSNPRAQTPPRLRR